MSIKITYELRRHDSTHFHGWIIWACSDGMEEEYFSSTSLAEAHAVFNDLHPEVLQTSGEILDVIHPRLILTLLRIRRIIKSRNEGGNKQ